MKPLFFLFLFLSAITYSQGLTADSKTILLLHFNGSLNGETGETPLSTNYVTFQNGMLGQGANFTYYGANIFASSHLYFTSVDNINAAEGTVEFWLNPSWNGNSGGTKCFFSWGTNFFLQKNNAGNLRFIINNDDSEADKAYDLSSWRAGQWHHIAITWKIPGTMKTYIDGVLKISHSALDQDLFTDSSSSISIGSKMSLDVAYATYDELRISKTARTEQEIVSSYLNGLQPTDFEISADYYKLWKTWKLKPEVKIISSSSEFIIDPSIVSWSSSNNNVATVNSAGIVTAVSGGTVDITGTSMGVSKKITLIVVNPILEPVEETIDPYLSTPAANYVYEIPVIIIRYLPTTDGKNLSVAYAPDYWSLNPVPLASMRTTLDIFDKRTKFILEEGSIFHGYKNSNARPSLGYKIIKKITVYEPVPPGEVSSVIKEKKVFDVYYNLIFERFGLNNIIEENNVKEVWINLGYIDPNWPSYDPNIHGPEAMINLIESNMSSPTTGDISNSYRKNNDLPILDHTYTVYDYNIRRSHAENVENHMHQIEALCTYVNRSMFWDKFVGFANNRITFPARCGWSHFPPNALYDYQWNNKTLVSSDIEDWNPDNTGERKMVNVDTWCSIPRNWPDNSNIDWTKEYSPNWFLYWMQNMPGYANQIQYGSKWMTNWWEFTADWDKAINSNLGLYAGSPTFIEDINNKLSTTLVLFQNYPNPFNPITTINYSIPKASFITIKIFDVLGNEIKTLVKEEKIAGNHSLKFNANKLTSGIYFYRMQGDNFSETKKFILLK